MPKEACPILDTPNRESVVDCLDIFLPVSLGTEAKALHEKSAVKSLGETCSVKSKRERREGEREDDTLRRFVTCRNIL